MALFQWTWNYFDEDGIIFMKMALFQWRWNYFDEDGIILMKLFWWRWHYFNEDGIISMKMALFRWKWHYFDEDGIISMKMALFRWRWHYFDEDGNISSSHILECKHSKYDLNMNTCFPVHPSWKCHSNFLPVRRFFPQTQVFQGFLVSSIGPVIQFTV